MILINFEKVLQDVLKDIENKRSLTYYIQYQWRNLESSD